MEGEAEPASADEPLSKFSASISSGRLRFSEAEAEAEVSSSIGEVDVVPSPSPPASSSESLVTSSSASAGVESASVSLCWMGSVVVDAVVLAALELLDLDRRSMRSLCFL